MNEWLIRHIVYFYARVLISVRLSTYYKEYEEWVSAGTYDGVCVCVCVCVWESQILTMRSLNLLAYSDFIRCMRSSSSLLVRSKRLATCWTVTYGFCVHFEIINLTSEEKINYTYSAMRYSWHNQTVCFRRRLGGKTCNYTYILTCDSKTNCCK